jgi:hypothetical protein
MKRLKLAIALPLLALLALFNANTAHAQSNWELGLRVGNDIAIDATIPTNGAPRLHLAAYFDDASAVGAYFDWMFAIEDGPLGLKFLSGGRTRTAFLSRARHCRCRRFWCRVFLRLSVNRWFRLASQYYDY